MNELPADWRIMTLGDVAKWGSGGTPKGREDRYYVGGSIPWIVIGDLNDAVVRKTEDCITELGLAQSSAKLIPVGSVLVAMYGASIGRLGMTDSPMTCNQAIAFADPNTEIIDQRFLFCYLRSQRDDLVNAGKGAAQPNIGQGVLKGWPIPIPPIEEQRRIVAIVEDHLSRVEAGERSLRDAERRLRSLELSTAEEIYSASSVHVSLADVTRIQGGIQKAPKRRPVANAYPFLRVANVTATGLQLDDVHTVELFDGELDRLHLKTGDLLVVEGNGSPSQIGRAAMWSGEIADCVHQNHLIRVRPSERLEPGYLETIWNAPSHRRQLQQLASSSSGLHTLSVSKLKSLSIPLPDIAVQRRLTSNRQEMLSMLDITNAAVCQQRSRARQLRKSLLSSAFQGELAK